MPPRSDKYYGNLVAEKFQRLVPIWKRGQQKATGGGALESPEEVEVQMALAMEQTAKKQRHISRRLYVCD